MDSTSELGLRNMAEAIERSFARWRRRALIPPETARMAVTEQDARNIRLVLSMMARCRCNAGETGPDATDSERFLADVADGKRILISKARDAEKWCQRCGCLMIDHNAAGGCRQCMACPEAR